MSHYKSNVRDQVFNLFEVFGLEKALGEGEYADLDAETAKEMLGEIARLAEGPIAESFADSDRNPPTFDPKTFTVSLPEPFKNIALVIVCVIVLFYLLAALGGIAPLPALVR